jgi:hypothetical protein
MNKTLSIYIQQYFAAYITAVTNPNTGGFNDSTPPITPDEFEKRLMEEALGPDFIHKPMDSAEIRSIQAAKIVYTYAYADFVNLPLNGDAPPAVIAWQTEARKG